MTTGSIVFGASTNTNEYYSKVWNGGDGHYEVSTGRVKWNNYLLNLYVQYPQYGPQTPVARVLVHPDAFQWSAADNLRLQSSLVKRIKGHQFNLAVDLAQANQLVKMCANTIRSMGRTLLHVKRGNISAALRELGVSGRNKKLKSKDVSGRWLEIQYGWLPAISSAYEAAKAFEALSMGRTNRVVASTKRVWADDAIPSVTYTAPAVFHAKGRIICELEEELSFGRSLGLTDPLQVAWELLPYSFVLDWFLPIGTYLENLAVIPHLKGRFCTTVNEGYSVSFNGSTGGNPVSHAGIKRTGLMKRVTRTVSTVLTTQRPTFVNPITAMTHKRIANAVSLAHQLIGD